MPSQPIRERTAPANLRPSNVPFPKPHLEADTRSPQILGSLHLLAAGTGKKSPALQSCLAPLGPGPVPPAHALGTDEERHGTGVEREASTRHSISPGGAWEGEPSPTMGRNSLMFPVRFPSMICQWNMS